MSAFTVDEVDNASKQDQALIKVRNFNFNGWPRRNVMDEKLLLYVAVRNELYCWSKYSVGRGAAIVLPESLYSKALQLACEDHFGIVRSKHQLRSFAWWPNCSAMLEQLVKNCSACCETDKAQVFRGVPNGKIITADEKFTTINIDIGGPYNGAPSNFKYLLLVVDEYSRWPEVYALDNTHAKQIVMSLKAYLARFGVPELIRCDEGSSFTSAEFKTFIIHQGAALKYSPLYCPRSNGLIERFNQTIRNLLRTTFEDSRSVLQICVTNLSKYNSSCIGKISLWNGFREQNENEVYSALANLPSKRNKTTQTSSPVYRRRNKIILKNSKSVVGFG